MIKGQKLNSPRIFKRLTKALMRLCKWAGWSEPLLVAHATLLEISCHCSYVLCVYNELIKTALLSTHRKCFSQEIIKLIYNRPSYLESPF